MHDAGDTTLEFAAHWDDEAVAADGDEFVLRSAVRGEFAQGGAQRLFNHPLLALLFAADAGQLRRRIIGQGAVRLDLSLNRLSKRTKRLCQVRRKRRKARQFSHQTRSWFAQQRLPCGNIVGETRNSLQLGSLESGFWNASLGNELRGIEEATKGDGDLLFEQEAEFACELVLMCDPGLVCRRMQLENALTADGGGGMACHEGKERSPFERVEIGVFDRGRDWIEQRHQDLSYGVGRSRWACGQPYEDV